MIMPRHLPPNSVFDDPAKNLDREAYEEAFGFAVASETLNRVFDWIMSGSNLKQQSLRCYLAALRICPQMLPCEHPSASWCGRVHGVTRQRASDVLKEFDRTFGDKIRSRKKRIAGKVKHR